MEPVPLQGPPPRTVLVWPMVPGAAVPPSLLLTGLDLAVRRRGYTIVASPIAERLLAEAEPSPTDDERVRRATGADAVLRLVVHEFQLEGEPLQHADWDLAWELTATASGALLWRFGHHGRWDRRGPDAGHPHPRPDEEAPPVLFGARPPDFRDGSDLVAWLHRFALERLPRGGA